MKWGRQLRRHEMKALIIKALETDANLSRTLRVLNTGDEWAIGKRYEEEYRRKTGGKEVEDDYILRMALSSGSHHIKKALQSWVKDDFWTCVKEQTGKAPDEIDFAIALHEALGQLRLGRTLTGAGFDGTRSEKPVKLPTEVERIKPRTIQRW